MIQRLPRVNVHPTGNLESQEIYKALREQRDKINELVDAVNPPEAAEIPYTATTPPFLPNEEAEIAEEEAAKTPDTPADIEAAQPTEDEKAPESDVEPETGTDAPTDT